MNECRREGCIWGTGRGLACHSGRHPLFFQIKDRRIAQAQGGQAQEAGAVYFIYRTEVSRAEWKQGGLRSWGKWKRYKWRLRENVGRKGADRKSPVKRKALLARS